MMIEMMILVFDLIAKMIKFVDWIIITKLYKLCLKSILANTASRV